MTNQSEQNLKHIANASIRSKWEVLAHSRSIELPTISTPEMYSRRIGMFIIWNKIIS